MMLVILSNSTVLMIFFFTFLDDGSVSSESESSLQAEDKVPPLNLEMASPIGVNSTGPGIMVRVPPSVPTISVTPHSPGILDEPLQQLQRIQQTVQRMRRQTITNPVC